MSKTVVKTGNIHTLTDTEQTDASEIIVPKRQFYDKIQHTKFIIDNCRKEIITQKTEKETLALKLKELEHLADMQFKQRKELEKQLETSNAELNILKNARIKQYSKCGIDLSQTDDINVLNAQIEQEVKKNIEKNKLKIVDPYLENIYKRYEIQK